MVDAYIVALVVVGLAIFGAAVLPRLLADKPLSLPILYVAGGAVLFALPHGVSPPDMVGNSEIVEHLTELVVIIALMGAGLKIDRPFSWAEWGITWRLLGVTMPVTIAVTAFLGHWLLGLQIATAVLLGAVVAPTDPVLASSIEAGPPLSSIDDPDLDEDDREHVGEAPTAEAEREVRFGLTSEAGLNDGLAFPFTHLAIVLAGFAGVLQLDQALFSELGWWAAYYVGYKIVVGVIAGAILGYVGGYIIFQLPATSDRARALEGAEALSGTLVIYGVTELVHGYGFIAVFVGALVLRRFEWKHAYYRELNDYAVMVERLLMAVVLVIFGGALAGGLLAPLTAMDVVVGLAILLLVRPLAGILGLLGSDLAWPSRHIVAGYGIRGIGSFYYLSFALNEATFSEFELIIAAERLWALLGFVVLASIVIHGVTASFMLDAFKRWAAVQEERAERQEREERGEQGEREKRAERGEREERR